MPWSWLGGSIQDMFKAAIKNEIHDYLLQVQRRLGKTIVMTPPLGLNYSGVITTDPRNVEHILKGNFDNYPKGPNMEWIFRDLLGRGIFNADGKNWSQQRKTTSHMFTANLFKEHIWAVVMRNAKKTRAILSGSPTDKPVDFFNLMNRFTLDTIGEIGFGKHIGSLEDPSSPFLRSFDRAQQIVMMRFVTPFWEVLRCLGVGSEADQREHFRRLDEYSRTVVQELQACVSQDGGKVGWADIERKKSFVGLFLADANKRGEHVSEDHLRDLVLNFLIAGRDTTAQALSWTVFLLSCHPEVEAKARQEVNEVCGVAEPKYDDINKLVYLNAILSEALRLYPSVPLDSKYALNDDVWPDGTFVPAGTDIFYNIYAMGRDPSIWGENAEEFRPERWLAMSRMPDNYMYPVFNGGPRECLGRRLAMIEMKTCLAMLLPHLTLKLAVSPDEVVKDSQLTIGMRRGMPCFVVPLDVEGSARKGSNASTDVCSSGEDRAELIDGMVA